MPLSADMKPEFPSDTIVCRTCLHRKPGVIGYKNMYCDQYRKGKPLGVLFEGAMCVHYERDESVE